MKIALLGYGKMGMEIERLSVKRNHEIVLIIDSVADWEKEGRTHPYRNHPRHWQGHNRGRSLSFGQKGLSDSRRPRGPTHGTWF